MSEPGDRVRRRRVAALALVVVAGCGRAPEWVAMPAQFSMPAGPEPAAAAVEFARPLLAMGDADIDAHIEGGMEPGSAGEPGRWTGARPAFRLRLGDVEGLEFYVRFFLPEVTFAVTGPVRLAITVNGVAVAAPVFRSEGGHEFQCAVAPGLLRAGAPVRVGLEVTPGYRAPRDGKTLGVLLFAVGFRRAER